MITCGFYNAFNDDRLYDAVDVSSIFDGIINDGIYMSIGTAMMVTSKENSMTVNVGIGRAWFNHTWTLNDSILPIEIPLSEIVLNRIDAIVLEINSDPNVRDNTIKLVKGTPSNNPVRPTLINSELIHQYPLAFIYVGAGVTSIRTANITNMVGTSSTPFVTGIIKTINIDSLVAQWGDQWRAWYEQTSKKGETDLADLEKKWNDWYTAITTESEKTLSDLETSWNTWYTNITSQGETDLADLEKKWNDWYTEITTDGRNDLDKFMANSQTRFDTWFEGLTTILDENTAARLTAKVLALEESDKTQNEEITNLKASVLSIKNDVLTEVTKEIEALKKEINENVSAVITELLEHAILDSGYTSPANSQSQENN